MRELVAAGALVMGLFSGVDIEHINDTPALVQEAFIEATGAELLALGAGMELGEFEGEQVVVTQEGFRLELSRELAAGMWTINLEVAASNLGNDSYWVLLDGQQLQTPYRLPVGKLAPSSFGFRLEQAGQHTVTIVLREGPGSVIRRAQLARPRVRTPKPPMRPELAAQHPRLLFTAADLPALRARLESEAGRRYYKLPATLTRKPPAYKPGDRNGGPFRTLGDYALGYLLTGDQAQLDACIQWLEAATTYPDCGVDLDAEYFMEGVALSYDWLYAQLPEDLRARVRDTIVRQCRELYAASLGGRTGGGHSYQQNHYWFAHLALVLGAAAVYGEVAEAEDWLAWGWDRAERIFLTFGTDGGFHEGPAYWDFSMPTLYMLIDLYQQCTGERIPWADQGLHGQAEFRFRYLYPGFKLSAALEDSSVALGRPPLRLFFWEARRFRDPRVMGLAEALVSEPSSNCHHLLSLDETVGSVAPFADLPLARHYQDVETVFARTSWGDDATALVLVSRPLGGHLWAELCDRFGLGGTGHNHPEQGHFVLFGRGEVLAADPGYTYTKLTRNHNTILVDGQGQYGDGEMWPSPKPGRARITGLVNEGDVAIIAADPCSAYPPELGLKRFERTVALAGPDLVVVCDRLQADQPRVFSWLLHHYGQVTTGQGTWTITRGSAQLTLAPIAPDNLGAALETYRPNYIHPTRDLTPKQDPDISLIELKSPPATEMTFLVPLLIAQAGSQPPTVESVAAENGDAVRVGEVVVSFRRGAGRMLAPTPWGENLATDARAVVARVVASQRQVISLP